MAKIWQIQEKTEDNLLAQLLHNRGISDADGFFDDNLDYDPMLLGDMEMGLDLIITTIKASEQILVYGDYDADGVTSSAVLLEVLTLLGAKVSVYIPDRVSEGYGMNNAALDEIAKSGVKLIITVDTGTRNKAEVEYAKTLGLKVIISDHHTLPEDLPDCPLINCADKRHNYPTKNLAGVGVAFKIAQGLMLKSKLDEDTRNQILAKVLDLVAIGTVSDMVPLLGENRALVKRGLEMINLGKRQGLKELCKAASITLPIDAGNIGFQIGPRLNAASRMAHANTALELLITKDQKDAEALALDLNQKNTLRQKITLDITAQIEKQIDPNHIGSIIIGSCELHEETWSEGVIGLVAGRIAEKYYRPTLVITKNAEGYKSSGRSIPELNLIEALEQCSEHLDKYGGHPMACGFSVYTKEKLDAFKLAITKLADEQLGKLKLEPTLKLDAELNLKDVDLKLLQDINKLAPYGQGNPQPKFATLKARVQDISVMGSKQDHIKFRINGLWALAFGKAIEYGKIKPGDEIDLAYALETNEFNGRIEPQLKIIDLRYE